MKNRFIAAVALSSVCLVAEDWQIAAPGYRYEFPRDHFDHPGYQTEWWYYTGNLHRADGRRFGFELTFFRQANHLSPEQRSAISSTWSPSQLYLAHLALSDIDGGDFYHAERLNRAGPGLAGASLERQRYWNGNWQVQWTNLPQDDQVLQAVTDRVELRLKLTPQKRPVIHGTNGVSAKGSLPGEASHYISFTRIFASGELKWAGQTFSVEGLAWMDHEFFTEPHDNDLAGWDWFAIQLDNNEELMLYRLRTRSGQTSEYSSGTYIDSKGNERFLPNRAFSLVPSDEWLSKASRARYPLKWEIAAPSIGLQLTAETRLRNQELFSNGTSPSYWEGAVTYRGRIHSSEMKGVGYLEMTGYTRPIDLGR